MGVNPSTGPYLYSSRGAQKNERRARTNGNCISRKGFHSLIISISAASLYVMKPGVTKRLHNFGTTPNPLTYSTPDVPRCLL